MSIIHKLKKNFFIRGCGVIASNVLSAIKGRSQFMRCADNVIITPPYVFINPKNIFLGPNTCIGAKSYISALNAKLICKGHCAIAENFTVHTGNHARVIGLYVTEVTEENKPKGYDKDVIIEEDVWIGCNVTILSGVTIGRGSTVAAGAVVTKSVPPYCICGGVQAKVIKFYWNIDQILEHEAKLYPQEKRYTYEELEEIFKGNKNI